jgi:hypothetical protein
MDGCTLSKECGGVKENLDPDEYVVTQILGQRLVSRFIAIFTRPITAVLCLLALFNLPRPKQLFPTGNGDK